MNTDLQNHLRFFVWGKFGIPALLTLLIGLVGWAGAIAVGIAAPAAFVAGLYFAPRCRHRIFKETPDDH